MLEEISEYRENYTKLCATTLLNNRATAKIILKMDIANKPIQKVTHIQINHCLRELTHYADSYIDKIHMQLQDVFNQAVLDEIINVSPFTVKR